MHQCGGVAEKEGGSVVLQGTSLVSDLCFKELC